MERSTTASDSVKHVNEIMQVVIPDLFQRSKSEARADSIEAMNRELPKICKILDLDPVTLEPINPVERNGKRYKAYRMATDKASLSARVGL